MALYQLTDEEALRLLEGPTASVGAKSALDNLTLLLGDKLKAVHALKEENRFINEHPGIPFGPAFAGFARHWLVENNLEWSQQNLWQAAIAERTARGFLPKSRPRP